MQKPRTRLRGSAHTAAGRRKRPRRRISRAPRLLLILAPLAIACVFFSSSRHRQQRGLLNVFSAPKVAHVHAVHGTAMLMRGRHTRQLTKRNVIRLGDRLDVYSESSLNIVYNDETADLQFLAETRIRIPRSATPHWIHLAHGRIEATTRPTPKEAAWYVSTPHAYLIPQDTRFTVTADPDKTDIEVLAGTLRVARTSAPSESMRVAAGYRATVPTKGFIQLARIIAPDSH